MSDDITLPREVTKFVLQVLEKGVTFKPGWVPECGGAVTALRAALDAPKQEPVAWQTVSNHKAFDDWWNGDILPTNPYPKDSPVFWAWAGWVMGVKAEREACAKVCEARNMGDNNREDMEARRCAADIRARGG